MNLYLSKIWCTLFATIAMLPLIANSYTISTTQELQVALENVRPGDEIIWRNGIYKDVVISFQPINNGTITQHIILRAETAGKVHFTGSSHVAMAGSFLTLSGFAFNGICTLESKVHVVDFSFKKDGKVNYANHCSLVDCAIINYTLAEESGKENYYVNLVGTYNEIEHCYFTGKTNKGPTLVIEYQQQTNYVPGSDVAPSTHHHIHHNYFGYRTFSSNGGEQIRVGTSSTSFSHGFNIIEYNYFYDERIEAEVISNKSWNNIYRFNTFIANDGAMVLRHGQQCFVYGNYINGFSGRKQSAGLRIVNPNNTVFNNYVENLEGGGKGMRAAIAIMSGLEDSPLNGYYPADNAIVAYNTVVNVVGPAIHLGVGNANKGKGLVPPNNVWVVGNSVLNTVGDNAEALVISNNTTHYLLQNNVCNNSAIAEKGFENIPNSKINNTQNLLLYPFKVDKAVEDSINLRLAIHHIHLTDNEITTFNPAWILHKKEVGVSWMKLY